MILQKVNIGLKFIKKNEMSVEQLEEINTSYKNIENELRIKKEDINQLQINL